jgi:hypothetical protein
MFHSTFTSDPAMAASAFRRSPASMAKTTPSDMPFRLTFFCSSPAMANFNSLAAAKLAQLSVSLWPDFRVVVFFIVRLSLRTSAPGMWYT